MLRGEVWWADVQEGAGSAPSYRRPVLIIQSDVFNRSRIGTVIVLFLSSNLDLADARGNVLLSRRVSGLPRDSVINVSQLAAVDRSEFTDRVSRLPDSVMRTVEEGLRLILQL